MNDLLMIPGFGLTLLVDSPPAKNRIFSQFPNYFFQIFFKFGSLNPQRLLFYFSSSPDFPKFLGPIQKIRKKSKMRNERYLETNKNLALTNLRDLEIGTPESPNHILIIKGLTHVLV